MTTEEGNLLIVEFMGGTKAPEFYGCTSWDIPNMDGYQHVLYYDTSWDWLMPVVQKIDSMSLPKHEHLPLEELTIFAEIDVVWNGVVEFIMFEKK